MNICSIIGCGNTHLAKGYCGKHYKQIRDYGKILERTKFDGNKLDNNLRFCTLQQNQHNRKIQGNNLSG